MLVILISILDCQYSRQFLPHDEHHYEDNNTDRHAASARIDDRCKLWWWWQWQLWMLLSEAVLCHQDMLHDMQNNMLSVVL
jgi:hypothetical protein